MLRRDVALMNGGRVIGSSDPAQDQVDRWSNVWRDVGEFENPFKMVDDFRVTGGEDLHKPLQNFDSCRAVQRRFRRKVCHRVRDARQRVEAGRSRVIR